MVAPDGNTIAAEDALELLEAVGITYFPWQRDFLTRMLTTRSADDTHWAASDVTLICPRQNGKSELILGRVLAGVLLFNERTQICTSHEYKLTLELLNRMKDTLDHPRLRKYVKRTKTMPGGEQIEWANGARTKFIARTSRSGRGFTADLVILDEAFTVTAENIAALRPTMSTVPNSQLFMLSSTGTYEAEVLLSERKRAYERPSTGLLYAEWGAERGDDSADPEVWARTNPSLGHLLDEERVRREFESMTRQAFGRERLGVWSETIQIARLDWAEVEKLIVPPLGAPKDTALVFGVDVALSRMDAAVVAAYRDPRTDVPVLAVTDYGTGSAWVEGRLQDVQEKFLPSAVAYDGRGGLDDVMDRASRVNGMTPMPLTTKDYLAACAALEAAIREKRVRFERNPDLIRHIQTGTSREFPSGWAWDRKSAEPPTTLVAATVALWALEHAEPAAAVYYFGAGGGRH